MWFALNDDRPSRLRNLDRGLLTEHPSHRAARRLPESVSFLFWAHDGILVDTAAFGVELRLATRKGSTTMACACGDRSPVAEKWDSPIYRDVSRIAIQDVRF